MAFLVILFILIWSAYIYCVIKDKRLVGFYLKGLTSFAFILVFALGFYDHFILDSSTLTFVWDDMHFAIFIMIGLVAGLIGDLFLELMHVDKRQSMPIMIGFGTVIFMIGHFFYIAGLIEIASFSYISLIIGAVMTLVTYFGGKAMKLNMGKIEILMYVYSFVIFTMIGQAIMNGFNLGFNTFSVVFMIGAVLFGISDLFLAPLYFGGEKRKSIIVTNLATYYFAQLLIAMAIYFL